MHIDSIASSIWASVIASNLFGRSTGSVFSGRSWVDRLKPSGKSFDISKRHARCDADGRASRQCDGGLLGGLDGVEDAGIEQRRHVTQLALFGDVAQEPAHDFAAAGLGQLRHHMDLAWLCDR
jgi:hypothetical protein